MWKLESEIEGKRVYINSSTGSRCVTSKLNTDKEGNDWYGFDDLAAIPYVRGFAANKITSLYTLGLTKEDLSSHVNGLKRILKSSDPDKYEKAYANVLDFEGKATNATDSIKQMSALVCVYFLLNDEPIDSFENNLQLKKMLILEADPELHSFFLQKQVTAIENYTTSLNNLLQIVSQKTKDLLDPSALNLTARPVPKET